MPPQVQTSTTFLLSREEISELLLHLLCNQRLFLTARPHLDVSLFSEDIVSAAVWSAAFSLGSSPDAHFPLDHLALRTEISSHLEQSDLVSADDAIELFGAAAPQWLQKKFPDLSVVDLEGSTGFLDRLRQVSSDQLDGARGQALLKRLIYERHVANPFRELLMMPMLPSDPASLKEEFDRRYQVLEEVTPKQTMSFSERWTAHGEGLKRFRGRSLIGLRTGMTRLDQNTLGLRDLMLLAALPGGGKTAFTIALSLGVCQHYQENDAVVVFVSLEMDSETILNRMKCNLADMDYTSLMFGSRSVQSQNRHRQEDENISLVDLTNEEDIATWFDADDRRKLCTMERRVCELQLGSRFVLLDRGDIRPGEFSQQIARAAEYGKAAANASRVLVVIDYLQVIPVPPEVEQQGDLAADRYRVALLQEILASLKSGPLPDCVLAISEARKPSKASETWGKSMSELMGSARLGYAASAVLLYSPMQDEDIKHYYHTPILPSLERESLTRRGVAPVEIKLVKGRDGMRRCSWGVEFRYMRNIFSEIDRPTVSRESNSSDGQPAAAPTFDGEERTQAPRRKVAMPKIAKKATRKRRRQ